jgi:hypothetical protein
MRVNKYFRVAQCKDSFWYVEFKDGRTRWMKDEDIPWRLDTVECIDNSCDIKTRRSFKKWLKRWSYLPKGTTFILINKYLCFDNVIGKIK